MIVAAYLAWRIGYDRTTGVAVDCLSGVVEIAGADVGAAFHFIVIVCESFVDGLGWRAAHGAYGVQTLVKVRAARVPLHGVAIGIGSHHEAAGNGVCQIVGAGGRMVDDILAAGTKDAAF